MSVWYYNSSRQMNKAAYAKIITDRELELIFGAVQEHARKERRIYWTTLICLGAYMGLRCSETVNIRLDDIDWLEKTLTIRKQKNGHNWEKVIIPDIMILKLKEHIKEYQKEIIDNETYLFFKIREDNRSSHLSTTGVRCFMKMLRKVTDINKVYAEYSGRKFYILSYHTLRHYHLTWFYDQVKDIQAVAVIGRHSNIHVTRRYVHLSTNIKADLVDKAFNQNPQQSKEVETLKNELEEIKKLIKGSIILPPKDDYSI